jgi:hypothetical protein
MNLEIDQEFSNKLINWDYSDILGWFEFIKIKWFQSEWTWTEESLVFDRIQRPDKRKIVIKRFKLYNAGWINNEKIIDLMKQNKNCWDMSWVQSDRSGKHIFDVIINEIKLA